MNGISGSSTSGPSKGQIIVELDTDGRRIAVLPADAAFSLAQALQDSKVYEKDGYGVGAGWKPDEKGLAVRFGREEDLGPTDPRVLAANEEAERQRKEWYEEYKKRQAAEKEAQELRAVLDAIKSQAVYTTPAAPDNENGPETDGVGF